MSSAVQRALWRSLLILAAAGIIAVLLYALSQSGPAPDWARAMNVSTPLILLNALAQNALEPMERGRNVSALALGLAQVARELVVLGGVISAVVLVRAAARYRSHNKR